MSDGGQSSGKTQVIDSSIEGRAPEKSSIGSLKKKGSAGMVGATNMNAA